MAPATAQLGSDLRRHAEHPSPEDVDRLIAARAASRDGVVTWAWMRGAGIAADAIDQRADRTLHRIYNGVYAVGHPALGTEGRLRAALDAAGEDAALAGFVGCERWGILDGDSRRIDVIAGRGAHAQDGFVLQRTRDLPPEDVVLLRGKRTLAPPRALLDIARLVGRERLEAACAQAAVLGLYDPLQILALLDRSRGRRGAKALRAVLAAHHDGEMRTRSRLERAFRRLLRVHAITPPLWNVRFGRWELDCHWPDLGFAVELDSRGFHDTAPAFHRDRDKDLALREASIDCLRLTWRHVVAEERRVARVLLDRVGSDVRRQAEDPSPVA